MIRFFFRQECFLWSSGRDVRSDAFYMVKVGILPIPFRPSERYHDMLRVPPGGQDNAGQCPSAVEGQMHGQGETARTIPSIPGSPSPVTQRS